MPNGDIMGPSAAVILIARFLNITKCILLSSYLHLLLLILLCYYRWNALTDVEQDEEYPSVAPNFIIELRSKSDSPQYVHNKMLRWINGGVEVSRQTMMVIFLPISIN